MDTTSNELISWAKNLKEIKSEDYLIPVLYASAKEVLKEIDSLKNKKNISPVEYSNQFMFQLGKLQVVRALYIAMGKV